MFWDVYTTLELEGKSNSMPDYSAFRKHASRCAAACLDNLFLCVVSITAAQLCCAYSLRSKRLFVSACAPCPTGHGIYSECNPEQRTRLCNAETSW